MAPGVDRCLKCGRSFNKIRIANALRGLFTFFSAFVLILAFIEFAAEEQLIPGLTFASMNTVLAAIVVLVLINLAASQTVKTEQKKYQTNSGLLCPACKDKVVTEEEHRLAVERSEKEKWQVELKSMVDKDPTLRSIIQDWRSSNGDATPDRATVSEFKKAINLGEAGNYEGAAQIYEDHKLWSLAGKAREKTRVQMVKHVTLDMNQLLEQIGSKGLAIPYKCQNCGASITIDKNSSASGLKFCSYCGTAYNVEEMSKIVAQALEI